MSPVLTEHAHLLDATTPCGKSPLSGHSQKTKALDPCGQAIAFSADLLWMPALGLELDEFLRYLVIGSLGEDAEDGPPGFIQMDAAPQWTPTGTWALLSDVPQLHDCGTQKAVFSCKAVVLHTDVKLVRVGLLLIAQDAGNKDRQR